MNFHPTDRPGEKGHACTPPTERAVVGGDSPAPPAQASETQDRIRVALDALTDAYESQLAQEARWIRLQDLAIDGLKQALQEAERDNALLRVALRQASEPREK